jgi:Flp pilus assembly pilin Flp
MKRKTQNFIEYAALIMVISGALLAMRVYIQRAINARLANVRSELNESIR